MMFDALRTPRRIILSGTPIQNDLGEFHAMASISIFKGVLFLIVVHPLHRQIFAILVYWVNEIA